MIHSTENMYKQRSLQEQDPVLYMYIQQEKIRQKEGLELIASENFTSRSVMECLGSVLTNKYAEGYAGRRYYGGTVIIDKIETLCQDRALAAMGCDKNDWGVNVQPYSGSPANFAVYTALLKPHDRIMGLDLPSGGHLTHGFYTMDREKRRKPVSATSVYFESLPYKVHEETGLIDYDRLDDSASLFKPALIICGGSAYAREWDYRRLREIADKNGAILHMDMAHISGLVATGMANSPFPFCDIVTTTTHKSLRGPRSGMIFYRKDERNFEKQINDAVFPALQGGPHQHQIAGVATQMLEVQTPEFKEYCKQVCANAKCLARCLIDKGYRLVTGGTDNHLILWDLRPLGLTGSKFEKLTELCNITLNKNTVPGDTNAHSPGGVRIGTCALTTRGFKEEHFEEVAKYLDEAIKISLNIQEKSGKKLKDFIILAELNIDVSTLKKRINNFARTFFMPGISDE